jgi:solute:Na+ symporter, SSS family
MTVSNEVTFLLIVTALVVVAPIWSYLRSGRVTFESYTVGRSHYSWPVISASIVGTIVGGGMFLAVGAVGYEAGVLGFVFGLVYLVGLCFFGLLTPWMSRRVDELGANSLSSAIFKFYGSAALRLFGFVSLVIYVCLISAQIVAVFQVYSYLAPLFTSHWYIIVPMTVAALSAATYSWFGGLQRDIQTDLVQSLVLFGCLLVLLTAIMGTEPIETIRSLPPDRLNGLGYGQVTLIGLLVFLTPSFLVRTDMWQRSLAVRTEGGAQVAFWIAGFISLAFYLCFTYLGMLGFVRGSVSSSTATMDSIVALFGTGLLFSAIMGAFFAAVLSSADTFINNAGIHLYSMVFPSMSTDGSMWHVRVCAITVTVAAVILAVLVADIVDIFVASLSLLLIFLPGILGMMFGATATERAFLWSTGTSLVVFAVLFFVWEPKSAFAPAVLVSAIVFLLIWRLTPSQTRA